RARVAPVAPEVPAGRTTRERHFSTSSAPIRKTTPGRQQGMNPTVAFLDSGIGGIPYLKYFLAQRQDIPTRYIADTRNFPYGLKTEAQLRRNLEVLVREQVLPYGIQMIAIVCNTASVAGLEFLRQRFPEL